MTVYKLIEVVGTSDKSIDDAIRGALVRASDSVEDLRWFEVKEIRGSVDDASRPEFQVKLHIGFNVHAPLRSAAEKRGAQAVGKKRGERAGRGARPVRERRR